MYGADMGELRLTNAAGEAVWSLSGDQGNVWQIVSVEYFSAEFAFEYTRGAGYSGDAAIAQVAVSCGAAPPPPLPPPPSPPSPPPSSPSPPLQPGSRYAISSSELRAALRDSAVSRIVLMAGTYEFADDMCTGYLGGSAVCIDRIVTIEAEVAGSVVLDAKGARRVVYVSSAGRAELIGLNITGGATDNGGSAPYSIYGGPGGSTTYKAAGDGGGLYIWGTATLTNTNVYENRAVRRVCSP
eukprot:scaffold73035_cov68-Phaeocystis_antarctica.AAC.1